MTSTSTANVGDLFDEALDEGIIGQASHNLLTTLGPDYNAQFAYAMGVSIDTVDSTELMLLTLLVDNSMSIDATMADQIRSSIADIVAALLGSKQAEGVLMSVSDFNGPIFGYTPLTSAPAIDTSNYSPTLGHTPLFDGVAKVLAGVVAKAQEFNSNGQPTRSVTIILTDGANNAGKIRQASAVANLVTDLERQEMHIVLFIGIDDGGYTDWHQVAADMGLNSNRVKAVGNNAHELRAAMMAASQSAVAASQATGSISHVGFGV